jgi:hypothetical protein
MVYSLQRKPIVLRYIPVVAAAAALFQKQKEEEKLL